MITYLQQRGDPAQTKQLLSELAEQWSDYPANVTRGGWYPARHTVTLYGAVARLRDDARRSHEELVTLGRHIAEEAKTMFLRLLIKFLTPSVFARKFPEFWRKDHNFGEVVVDSSRFDQQILRLTLSKVDAYDYIGPVCMGWIQSAFEAMGKEKVAIHETERSVEQWSAPSYCFELTWQ